MTNEEAIKNIQDFTGWFKKDKPIYEALEMAIQALSQEPCEDCDYSEIMDWEQDAKTGKTKPIYWCERHKELEQDVKLMLMEANINGYTEGLKDSSKIEPCDDMTVAYLMGYYADKEQKWIPVSERMPEDGIPCICTVYNTDIYRDNIQVYDNYLVYDEYTEQWIDDDMELCLYDVIAWMPKPKPYKPQESCEKCLYAEETDGSHCYECVKGESKFDPQESEE